MPPRCLVHAARFLFRTARHTAIVEGAHLADLLAGLVKDEHAVVRYSGVVLCPPPKAREDSGDPFGGGTDCNRALEHRAGVPEYDLRT